MHFLGTLAALPLFLLSQAALRPPSHSSSGMVLPAPHLRAVMIRAQDGAVAVQTSSEKSVSVRLSPQAAIDNSSNDSERGCSVRVRSHRGVVRVRIIAPRGTSCTGQLVVTLPEGTPLVQIRGGRDEVKIRGLLQYVSILTTQAAVDAQGTFAGLTVHVDRGSIQAAGVLRDIDVQSNAGSARVAYDAAPLRGKVHVALACGDLVFAMPGPQVAMEVQLDDGWLQQNELLHAGGAGPVRVTGRIREGSVVLTTPSE